MLKEDAEKLARFLGVTAEQTGGDIYNVSVPLPNGMKIIFCDRMVFIQTKEDSFSVDEILMEWEG